MRKRLLSFVCVLLLLSLLIACQAVGTPESITIKTYDHIQMVVGDALQLEIEEVGCPVSWSSSNDAVAVNTNGLVMAMHEGTASVTATCGVVSDSVTIEVRLSPDSAVPSIPTTPSTPSAPSTPSTPSTPSNPPTSSDDGEENEGGHTPATSYAEALERSRNGVLSGYLTVPDQAPTLSEYRPMKNGKYILNTQTNFADANTYVVVDVYGSEVFRVYRGGGYITLEEVAAYVYAFGDVPANYVSDKDTEPEHSIWGEYLRLNHSRFTGNTKRYPYEPELPNISGCGGDLQYYEIDIGTTGTDCDPDYPVRTYNDGDRITRGAARIVYGKYDLDRDGIYEFGEHHLFYTYNHYNDFQEYLNYYGGWGEMFGNITGGGSISSKTNYNPTPYVSVIRENLPSQAKTTLWCFYAPEKYWLFADERKRSRPMVGIFYLQCI